MTQTLHIEGHASLFDLPDLGGDVVRRGAFAASLRTDRPVPMLYQHDPAEPVGVWTDIREDSRGLRVRGEILADSEKGRTAQALVRRGVLTGLSIGFRTLNSAPRSRDGRDLFEIEL